MDEAFVSPPSALGLPYEIVWVEILRRYVGAGTVARAVCVNRACAALFQWYLAPLRRFAARGQPDLECLRFPFRWDSDHGIRE